MYCIPQQAYHCVNNTAASFYYTLQNRAYLGYLQINNTGAKICVDIQVNKNTHNILYTTAYRRRTYKYYMTNITRVSSSLSISPQTRLKQSCSKQQVAIYSPVITTQHHLQHLCSDFSAIHPSMLTCQPRLVFLFSHSDSLKRSVFQKDVALHRSTGQQIFSFFP